MKQNYKLVLFLMLTLTYTTAQAKPTYKTGFEEAEAAYAENKLVQAEELYLKVLRVTPDHFQSNARLGSLYLGLNQPARSVAYLKKALEMRKSYSVELNKQLGLAYQLSNDFDNAITLYFDLLKRQNKNSAEIAVYQKKINECVAGKQLFAHPVKVQVRNLGALVNSASTDHVPVLTTQDKTMLFTSQRPKITGKLAGNNQDEDIFLMDQQENGWSEPKRLEKPFNSTKHEAILAVTADGNKMYLYNNKEANGDIYESEKVNGAWKAPVKLGKTINTRHHELSFTLSADGNFAFFSSDRPGGFGGMDLYMSINEGNGKWSEAINLGSNINTAYDEDAPFLNNDNSVMYFSSKGHNSMGGYDIFKSTIKGTAWSVAQNMGVPVNSSYDDAFYVQTQDSKIAYFSSDRPGGFGESDIYAIVAEETAAVLDKAQPEGVFTAMLNADYIVYPAPGTETPVLKNTYLLTGYITDALTRKPLNTQVTLLDKTLFTTEAIIQTDENGYFELEVAQDRNYGLVIESEGYPITSQPVVLPERPEGEAVELRPLLIQDSAHSALALQNVHFFPNHDYIKSYSLAELDWLYTYLQDNPTLDVLITDYINPDDTIQYKKNLNAKRAAAVIKYLRSKGLEAGRVSFQAKKDTQYKAKNSEATGMIISFMDTE
jgi:outer membrane protein OmpA-like peptidoglycan-associated protein